ncbi:MAG: hypothetical protein LBP58_07505 [Azoarcus sp.]|jgi:hypothetical protein|nr:hypothetical protein [Azoarcus sp.]
MLEDIVETAYRTFAAYTAPEDSGCQCPLCRLGESHKRLRAMAVREIPDELLWRYHFAAHGEKTSVREIKHFLPRYLEIVSHFQFDHFWAEIALNRLSLAKDEWTLEEHALLKTWAQAFFAHCLSQYYDRDFAPDAPYIENIVDLIIMLAHGNFDLGPLLDDWSRDTRLPALLHFKDLLLWGFNKDMSALENSFAADDQPLCAMLADWVRQPGVAAHFIAACDKAIEGSEPILDMAHACHAGRAHREEIRSVRQKLRKWQHSQNS